MPLIKNGVEVALVSTPDALTYVGVGRTRFYEFVRVLDLTPIPYGNSSRWRPADLDKIVEHIASGAAACDRPDNINKAAEVGS